MHVEDIVALIILGVAGVMLLLALFDLVRGRLLNSRKKYQERIGR